MIKVKQLPYSEDNFAYILYADSEAIVIDPGCPDEIVRFLNKNNLKLTKILNTHSHYDHTLGNKYLEEKTGVVTTVHEELRALKLAGYKIEVIPTPGHTADSVCYKTDTFVITGDTLFIANVGNCPDSLMSVFKRSLDKLLSLPDNLIVYPGHDYTERSLKRAGQLQPENKNIPNFKKYYDSPPVSTTIGDEKKINPYLRTNIAKIREHLRIRGKNTNSEFECFKSFMELY